MMYVYLRPPDASWISLFLLILPCVFCIENYNFSPEDCPSGSQGDPISEVCTHCPIGYYREKGTQLRCERCPAGYITQEIGAGKASDCDVPVGLRDTCVSGYEWASSKEKCVPCPAGTYRTQGVQYWCISCPDSTNTTLEGATSVANCLKMAKTCGSGTEWNETTHACEPCKQGKYRTAEKNGGCVSCPANHITPFTGATSPMDCVAIPSDEQIFTMDSCPAGTEYDVRLVTCRLCPVNTYRRQVDGLTCRPCPEGHVTIRPGATHETVCLPPQILPSISYENTQERMKSCPLGTEWSEQHMSCSSCPVGTYREDVTLTLCQKCPQGQETPIQGAIYRTTCGVKTVEAEKFYKKGSCVPGTYWDVVMESCRLCPFGTFSPEGEQCVSCANGRMTAVRGATTPDACILPQIPDFQSPFFTQDSCPSGSEWNPATNGCQPCPRGYYRLVSPSEGGPRRCRPCLLGFTTFTTGSIFNFMCVIPTTGPDTLPIGTDGCPAGYEANATVCTVCPAGHYKSSAGWDTCTMCPSTHKEAKTLGTGASDVNDCVPSVSIEGMDPTVGPQAGGTVVTLKVTAERPVRVYSISIAGYNCQPLALYLSSGSISCVTSAVRELPAGGTLGIETSHGLSISSPTFFRYQNNPIVDGVNRMKSIKSGGQDLIVYGRHMDSIAFPVLLLAPTNMASEFPPLQMPCRGEGPSAIVCMLPALPKITTRKRRDAKSDLSPLVEFDVGFQLDGVQNYSRLQEIYPQYDTLKIYEDPEVYNFDDDLIIGRDTTTIKLFGRRLDLGSTASDYNVYIDACKAKVLTLTYDNIITELCDIDPDKEYHSVTVNVGILHFSIGRLRLEPDSQKDRSRRVLLPVLLTLLSLLLLVFIIIIVLCASQRHQRKQRQLRTGVSPMTTAAPSELRADTLASRASYRSDDENTLPPLPVDSVFGPERVTDKGLGMRKLALPKDGSSVEFEPGEKTDLMRYRIVAPGTQNNSYYTMNPGAPREAWSDVHT